MAKIRIHEIAKELGYDSKEIIEKANELGLGIKTASNAVEPEIAAAIYEYIQTREIPEAFKKNIKTPKAKKLKKENTKELNESEKKNLKKKK
ncbi:translation initiation factor IF-2 N-terminal domain-containing protein, partial [Campylobacter jejuni]|nr:translation initiation factor IF-2 N-terminal domain-containing protein [Campylobacter jejuni]